jgi:hypothetical protein
MQRESQVPSGTFTYRAFIEHTRHCRRGNASISSRIQPVGFSQIDDLATLPVALHMRQ